MVYDSQSVRMFGRVIFLFYFFRVCPFVRDCVSVSKVSREKREAEPHPRRPRCRRGERTRSERTSEKKGAKKKKKKTERLETKIKKGRVMYEERRLSPSSLVTVYLLESSRETSHSRGTRRETAVEEEYKNRKGEKRRARGTVGWVAWAAESVAITWKLINN